MDIHQRLRVARLRFYPTAKAAAASIGVPYGTYSGHEAGTRGIKKDELALYARRFKAPLPWLAYGIGAIDDAVRSSVAVVGRIGAGAQIDVFAEQSSAEFESVVVKLFLPPGAIAFEVFGDSMWPRCDDGDLVIVDEEGTALEQLNDGVEAAVRTEDGVRYLKKVLRSETPGLFNLESHNAPPIRGVRLVWASEVSLIVPRSQRGQLRSIGGDDQLHRSVEAAKRKGSRNAQ